MFYFAKWTILLLSVVFNPVTSHSIFGTTSYGFLSVLNRTKPILFLLIDNGIYLLDQNLKTCYNNDTIYYNTGKTPSYISSSLQDNYLMYVTDKNTGICFTNLYKSQWTNALFRVDTRKCQTLKESNRVIYSQSREILYSMSGVTVSLLSGILPMCSFGLLTVYEALEQFNLFHITNFANHSDYLLLGSTSKGSVAVLNPYGQILKELKFPSYFGATSLTSNSESLFISFTNYDSLESSIIIEYDPDLKKKEGHEIELEIVSFITASTDYIIGISKDRDKIVSINLKDREPEWLDCTFTNLKNVALVDNNAPYVKRDVCGENSSVCHNIGNIVGCDNKALFRFPQQRVVDELQSPQHHKSNLTNKDSVFFKKYYLVVIMAVISIVLIILWECILDSKQICNFSQ